MFASLVLLMAAEKVNKKKPWKTDASSGHITNLKQFIWRLLISMVECSVAVLPDHNLPETNF